MNMTTPLMIWCLVVGIFLVVLLVTAVLASHRHRSHHTQIFGFSTEREEFFVPGDPTGKEPDYNDD